jgi:hypothetical protein
LSASWQKAKIFLGIGNFLGAEESDESGMAVKSSKLTGAVLSGLGPGRN